MITSTNSIQPLSIKATAYILTSAEFSTHHKYPAFSDTSEYLIPFYQWAISAGFPSPAEDYVDGALNLNELLIKHPAATFFVRVVGNSMVGAGIFEGDILIVDRSLTPTHRKIVIAAVDGKLLVRRLIKRQNKTVLIPESDHDKPITLTEDTDITMWGVVTTVLHQV